MKVISLTQPWASLVAVGEKKIETRSWRTPYRGTLAIHAAKGFPRSARLLAEESPFANSLAAHALYGHMLPLGQIIAVCDLGDVLFIHQGRYLVEPDFTDVERHVVIPPDEPEKSFGDYSPGRYMWLLENVRMLKTPIPARGALGLWNYEGELGELLE